MKVAIVTKGESGLLDLDADGWRTILISRAFGTATLDLRKDQLV